MPFITVPGLTGRLYVPETPPEEKKKHACPDCFACQNCGPARCHICRSGKRDGRISIRDKMEGNS